MANMSYCRFQNTYFDLCDCYENMDDELSEDETKYRKRMLELCKRIVDNYCDEDEDAEQPLQPDNAPSAVAG